MRKHRILPGGLLAAAMLVGVTGVTGCLPEDETANASNTPALAAPPPSAQEVAARRKATTVAPMKRAAVVRAVLRSPQKWRTARINLEVKVPGAGLTAKGKMSYVPGKEAVDLTVGWSFASVDHVYVIVKDGLYYIDCPCDGQPGVYESLDPKDPNSLLGADFAKVSDQLDAVQELQGMRAGFRTVRYVGSEKLYGSPMAHYTVKVDTAAGLAAHGTTPSAQKMPATVTYHVWMDRKQRLRKLGYRAGKVEMNAEMSGWGKPVRIRTPDGRGRVA